jgi:Anti-sigma-K factor rskA
VSQSDLHAPDDLLALHATGDPLPEAMARHLGGCAQCQSELDQWVNVVSTGRSATRDDTPGAPPAHVWENIQRELSTDDRASATVVSLDSRRRWSSGWLAAASVAGIIGGAVLTAGGSSLMRDDAPAPVAAPPVIASTTLAALPEHEGSGAVEIVQAPGGGKELVVDVSDLTAGDGFYEVWLIDPETFQMVGLGALTDTSGRFPVPEGLDLRQYSVVDVSLEPLDGDPVHSRDSVVRGELST